MAATVNKKRRNRARTPKTFAPLICGFAGDFGVKNNGVPLGEDRWFFGLTPVYSN